MPEQGDRSFVEMLEALLPAEARQNLALRGECAACGAKGAKRKCARCSRAWYCNIDCAKHGWKVLGHKAQCVTHEEQAQWVVAECAAIKTREQTDLLENELREEADENKELDYVVSLEAAALALELTRYEPSAAKMLCGMVGTCGLIVADVRPNQMAYAMQELFGVDKAGKGITVESLLELEASLGVAAKAARLRAERRAAKVKLAREMQQVFDACEVVCASLAVIMPQVQLMRPPASPHKSNRAILDFHLTRLRQTRQALVESDGDDDEAIMCAPTILLFGDECMKGLMVVPQNGCPQYVTTEFLTERAASLAALLESTWIQYGRTFEQDQISTDKEVLELARGRHFVYFFSDIETKVNTPGFWLPQSIRSDPVSE
eukprot:CAMPEP_0170157530 /NCGR_PEP_ID=MMETSP0033_2-20121228/66074_1 /TAXON_ID=195969 /ORGANISM="Dolichomastix tenuilepis, Strain CCMP3274" /LENGTH=376 /DNA_ID=CAMNT_0010394929 /DNA_START=42 /DNA_END=1172 /DNA_ORIENTATION=+